MRTMPPTGLSRFPCPHVGGDVELSLEREQHIAAHHPDLLPEHRDRIAPTLADPDEIRRSKPFGNARLFSRWYDDVRKGKHVVVVVVSESEPQGRHWIITAYMASKLAAGEVEWARS